LSTASGRPDVHQAACAAKREPRPLVPILRFVLTEAHMRHVIFTVVLVGSTAAPGWAQGGADRYQGRNEGSRYSADAQGIPRGHLPPPGQCRVWYDGQPAGHQPPPTSCAAAERAARRNRAARVVYGGDRHSWDDRSSPGAGDRGAGAQTDSPRLRHPDRGYPHDQETRTIPYEQGFKDGRDEGRDDRRDDKRFDPTRHERYQSADRGYERRLGDKDAYRDTYREGFRAGYAEGYRGVLMTSHER
jgi:hypothetical protein